MTGRLPFILAATLGSLCAAFALVAYQGVASAAAMPFATGGFDGRFFWWPLSAAILLWMVACLGLMGRGKRVARHNRASSKKSPGSVKTSE